MTDSETQIGGSDDDHHDAKADNSTVARETTRALEDRVPVSDGPGGRTDVSRHPKSGPEREPEVSLSDDDGDGRDDEEGSAPRVTAEFRAQVLAVVAQEQHNHLHLPGNGLDPEGLVRLREAAPEVYQVYVSGLEQAISDESYKQRSEVNIPAKYLSRGQLYGLISVLASLLIVAYAIFEDALWIAGVIGVLDLAVLAAVFTGRDLPWATRQQSQTAPPVEIGSDDE